MHAASAQQTIQLFQEDFNAGNNSFTLNSGGPASNTGSNTWTVNSEYNGNGVYPNTTPQTSTSSGTIAGAPNSPYLHIYDNATATATNCNYDNNTASDNFAQMTGGFCTVGLTDIKFTFFYLAEGNAADYGRVYYSIDGGGSWIQCGSAQYNNTTLWTYQVITDPAFENQPDIRFGFRWTNATGSTQAMSFGVDDIIAVGTYDDTNPVQLTITDVQPNPVCEGGYVTISYNLSYPLCDGTYEIQLSNSAGGFSPGTNLGVFTIFTGQTTGAVTVQMPSTLGPCFKIRINRVSPPPAFFGEASVCIEIIDCPNTITTLQPAVTLGPDTLCNESVIDVPFYSTGAFNNSNQYIAQLSDASGSFASPTVLGALPSSATFDPLLGSPPGSVSGLVPGVPPGCNYYIRVISTSPAVTPSPPEYFGPFCIRECDVTTNNMQDIQVCITPTDGVDTTITFEIDSWNNGVTYGPGNEFQVQVLNSQFYTVINTGGLGTVTSTTGTSLTLSIPNLPDLVALLGAPGYGMYYLRIVPTNASSPSDTLGTLVRLIIGTINPPGVVTPDDSILCAGGIVSLFLNPYNYDSQYEWFSPSLSSGQPFFWSYNPLMVQFNASTPPGTHWFTVREQNFGCWSPWSDTVNVHIIGTPNVNIQSTTPVCVGDSVHFWVPFLHATYYEWEVTSGTIVEFANNEITVIFDSAGTYTVSVFALNECGSNSGSHVTNVLPRPEVIATDPPAVCNGSAVALASTGNGGTIFGWLLNGDVISNTNAANVVADSTAEYVAFIESPAGCKDYDTVAVDVYPNPILAFLLTDITCHGLTNGSVQASVSSGTAPYALEWNDGQSVDLLQDLGNGTYSVTTTDANGCVTSGTIQLIEPQPIALTVLATPATYGQSNATAAAVAAGGTEPYAFTWSTQPPFTGNPIEGLTVGTYTITVVDAEGCSASTTVDVEYAANGLYVPNVFSPNADGRNDVFDFYGINMATARVMIFNRWGEKVFESADLERKWNGTFRGMPVEIGAYAYVIEATFLDGETKSAAGNVTLLR
ncbi:MAG TPA: gliding motility-associated C-terminal domain-containing protein [Chitinophagales bacterium]|nr:gliding motility-associated C-terminal domain-containing protein [Chitinophagales bacterium]